MEIFKSIFSPYYNRRRTGFYLFGHNVTEKKPINSSIQCLGIEVSKLNIIIKTLQGLGFSFITMEESLNLVSNKSTFKKPWIHLTFDDGYRDNYTVLYPFLKSKNIPFTIFVSTRNLLENKRFDIFKLSCSITHSSDKKALENLLLKHSIDVFRDLNKSVIQSYKHFSTPKKEEFLSEITNLLNAEQWSYYNELYSTEAVMSPEQLKILSEDPLVHIGSHGHNHYILSTLSKTDVILEQELSRDAIFKITGKFPETYCYPNGKTKDIPEDIDDLMKSSGHYKFGFTTIHKSISSNENLYRIPRFPLSMKYLPMLLYKLSLK